MNNKQINIIDQAINQILQIINGLRKKNLEHKDLYVLYVGHIWTSDYDTEREIYQKLIRQIHDANPDMLSLRIINEKLLGIIGLGIWNPYMPQPEEEIVEKARILVENMITYEALRDIDLPIANLKVRDTPFTLGKVTLYPFSESDKKDDWWEWIRANMKGNEINVQAFARVKTPGDLHVSAQNAVVIVEDTLLVLRGIGFPFVERDKPQITTINNFSPYESRTFRVHKADENVRFEGFATTMAVGSEYSPLYSLEEEILKDINIETVRKISELMNKQNLSAMEQKIIQGIRWIGEATQPDANASRLVKLSIALETLIGGDTKDPYLTTRGITATLAERAAFLIEEDFEQRTKTDRMIKDFYKKRSLIVHGGDSQLISLSELSTYGQLMRQIAWKLLGKVETIRNVDELQQWVHEMRYK